jgi:oxygen-dependent protoporphyrinogen oxidase
MFSFDGGMQVLIDALAARFDGSIRVRHSVAAMERKNSCWRMTFRHGAAVEHGAVLLCAPAHQIGQWLSSTTGLSSLVNIYYPPIVRVVLGFRRDQIAHPLDGFGVLIPAKEPFESLGVFFSSSVFAKRAPDGHVSLTVFAGGSRNPELYDRDGLRAMRAALSDTRRLLGISGAPEFQDVRCIPHSIPQYELGYAEIKRSMKRLEDESPGLFFAGNYRDGIGVSDSILSGFDAAGRIAAFLHNGTNGNSSCKYRVA